MGPHELWAEPWEGLPEEEAAWEWELIDDEENGPTQNPPDNQLDWKRWYFIYHEPSCTNIKNQREPRATNRALVQSPSVIRDYLIMKRAISTTKRDATEREALRRRVKQFYARFNKSDWEGCYALIDPQLTRCLGFPAQRTPQNRLVPRKRTLHRPPLTVDPLRPRTRGLWLKSARHLTPIPATRIARMIATIERDHAGADPQLLPRVTVMRLGIGGRVRDNPVSVHTQSGQS